MWVSTAIVGFPKPSLRTTFAVFLPTPGSLISSLNCEGTLELYDDFKYLRCQNYIFGFFIKQADCFNFFF
ncbi:MAG: hypothetical protein CM15mP93_01520 [Thiotrichaceae bacterium]|nr:MAG: hypothetical protein CM15mP93_01520 [Thiotrichaceae bacterium]